MHGKDTGRRSESRQVVINILLFFVATAVSVFVVSVFFGLSEPSRWAAASALGRTAQLLAATAYFGLLYSIALLPSALLYLSILWYIHRRAPTWRWRSIAILTSPIASAGLWALPRGHADQAWWWVLVITITVLYGLLVSPPGQVSRKPRSEAAMMRMSHDSSA